MNKSIILLSGGLDSVISIAECIKEYNISLAITFDYGQKSLHSEINSAKQISKFYSIEHKIINIDWLKEISSSALNTEKQIPIMNINELNNKIITEQTAKSVWVPNRNALFINIAACIAEAQNYNYIILGANKEEAATFKDNTQEFINAINNSLKNSTNKEIKVIAPLINLTKEEIVKKGIELQVPFKYIHSCYLGGNRNCGKCESCQRLKRALKLNNRNDIILELFQSEN